MGVAFELNINEAIQKSLIPTIIKKNQGSFFWNIRVLFVLSTEILEN